MKTYLFFLIPLFLIPSLVFAQQGPPDLSEVDPKYWNDFVNETPWTKETYDVETLTGSLIFYPAPRLQDESGEWKNYVLDESDSNIIYRVHEGAIIFDKPSCSISVYDNPYILNDNTRLIDSHSFSLQEAVNGTDIWSDITPSQNCNVTMTNNGTHILVSGQYDEREINAGVETGGIFKTEYAISGHSVETFGIYENHDDLKDGTHKYKVTETIDADIQETKRKDQIYQNDFVLGHEELNDENEIFEFKIKDKKIRYDISKALKDQWTLKVQNDKKKIVSDFAKDKKALKKGDRVLVDPTLTLDSTGTYTDFMVEDANAGDTNACDTYSTGSDTSATGQVKSEVNTGSDCYFMGFHFEGLAAIAGNTVTEVKAKIETTACFTCDTTDFVRVTTDTNTQGATFFNECRDETGTVVKDNFSEWQTVSTNNEIILDDNTHMQTILDASEDDVTYCLRMNTLNANSNNEIRLATEEASGTPDGMELTITYSAAPSTYDIKATIFENDNSTSVGNSFVSIYNQSSTTTKKMDGSGTHPVTDLFWGEDKNVHHNVTVIGDGSAYPAYIINQSTIWLPPKAEYTVQSWIYRFDCSSNGAGDDGIFMFNGSYDSVTGSTGHFFNTTSFTDCDSNDVVKFTYKSNANGTLQNPTNPDYEGEIFVRLLNTDSWHDEFEKITAEQTSLTTTASGANITSSSYDAGTAMDIKNIELYFQLANLEDLNVHAYYYDGADYTGGNILQENRTGNNGYLSRTVALNSSGIAGQFTGLNLANFTLYNSTHNLVLGEINNQNLTDGLTKSIFAQSKFIDFRAGTGNDLLVAGVNSTEGHTVKITDPETNAVNDYLDFTAIWKTRGTWSDTANHTSILVMEISNSSLTTITPTVRANGSVITGSTSGGVYTSDSFQVGNPNTDITLDFTVQLSVVEVTPDAPVLDTATAGVNVTSLSWTPQNATWTEGYCIWNGTTAGTMTGYACIGNVTSYIFIDVPNITQFFNITAYSTTANSTGSNNMSSTTFDYPPAPSLELKARYPAALTFGSTSGGASDSPVINYGLRCVLNNGTAWLDTVSNSTLPVDRYYQYTGLSAGDILACQWRDASRVGFSAFSGNASGITPLPPNAVETLTGLVGEDDVDLSWTAPDDKGETKLGYQINYSTPWGDPMTVVTNNTGTTSVEATVSSLTGNTNYSMRVSLWTIGGNNATGFIYNFTTLEDFSVTNFTVGAFDLEAVNPDRFEIEFEIQDETGFPDSKRVNVTYPDTYDLACDFAYQFAQTNQTYDDFAFEQITTSLVESSFLFHNVTNDQINIKCWDRDSGIEGRYLIAQSSFPLLQQFIDFRNGEFGTSGDFGAIDFITLAAIIVSMMAFNRKNTVAGGIVTAMFLGALSWFGIIAINTIILGAIALVILLMYGVTRKDE